MLNCSQWLLLPRVSALCGNPLSCLVGPSAEAIMQTGPRKTWHLINSAVIRAVFVSPAIPKPSRAGMGDRISKRPAAAFPTFQPDNMVSMPANHERLEPPHRVCGFFKRASWQPYHGQLLRGTSAEVSFGCTFLYLGCAHECCGARCGGGSPFLAGKTVGIVETRNDYLRSMIEARNLYSYLLRRSTNTSWPQAERRARFQLVHASLHHHSGA